MDDITSDDEKHKSIEQPYNNILPDYTPEGFQDYINKEGVWKTDTMKKPDCSVLYNKINNVIKAAKRPRPPLPAKELTEPLFISILGGPCSGKTTQMMKLREKYTFNYIDINILQSDKYMTDDIKTKLTEIREAENPKKDDENELESAENQKEDNVDEEKNLPIEIFTQLFENLCKSIKEDEKDSGCIFDGLPMNPEQGSIMQKHLKSLKLANKKKMSSLGFDLVLYLSGGGEDLKNRVDDRLVDPETGFTYSKHNMPWDENIESRLVSITEKIKNETLKKRTMKNEQRK
eukprot:UN30424